jgi:CHAD domain-containing protein
MVPTPGNPDRDRVLALMREQREALRAHELGIRQGQDPEDLHQMRVAVRRLRAILGAVRDMFDARWVRNLRDELDWLGAVLGASRDLDVLRDYLRTQAARLGPDKRQVAREVVARLDAKRDALMKKVVAALDSPRHDRLLHRLDAAVEHPPVRASVSLPDVAGAAFKKLRKSVKALPDEPTDRDLHAVRLRVKRARYAAELAAPLAGPPAARFIERAKKVQDALGEHQDAAVAERRLRALLAKDARKPARALSDALVAKQRARQQAAKADFLDRWPGLKRRGRKAWESA